MISYALDKALKQSHLYEWLGGLAGMLALAAVLTRFRAPSDIAQAVATFLGIDISSHIVGLQDWLLADIRRDAFLTLSVVGFITIAL